MTLLRTIGFKEMTKKAEKLSHEKMVNLVNGFATIFLLKNFDLDLKFQSPADLLEKVQGLAVVDKVVEGMPTVDQFVSMAKQNVPFGMIN